MPIQPDAQRVAELYATYRERERMIMTNQDLTVTADAKNRQAQRLRQQTIDAIDPLVTRIWDAETGEAWRALAVVEAALAAAQQAASVGPVVNFEFAKAQIDSALARAFNTMTPAAAFLNWYTREASGDARIVLQEIAPTQLAVHRKDANWKPVLAQIELDRQKRINTPALQRAQEQGTQTQAVLLEAYQLTRPAIEWFKVWSVPCNEAFKLVVLDRWVDDPSTGIILQMVRRADQMNGATQARGQRPSFGDAIRGFGQ